MEHINNNVLAVFAVVLLLFSLITQVMLYQEVEKVRQLPITGKATTGTGTITFTIKYPISTAGFVAVIADDNSSIFISWDNYSGDNYTLYASENVTGTFNYTPIAEGLTILNYTDTAADNYPKRFYRLGVWQSGSEEILNKTVGKWDIELDNGWNLISLPLDPVNISIMDIFGPPMTNGVWGRGCPANYTGYWSIIWQYDSGWSAFDPNLACMAIDFQTLQNINFSYGYWIRMNDTFNLTIAGSLIDDQNLLLSNSWNLAGFTISKNSTIKKVLGTPMTNGVWGRNCPANYSGYWSVLWQYDAGWSAFDPNLMCAAIDFQPLQNIKPDLGYWLRLNETYNHTVDFQNV